jgi:dTDP-glucose 4,6-dehydratase
MQRKILVIGSNSFSGSNLIKVLLSNDDYVTGMSRQKEIQSPYNPYEKITTGKFEFVQMNVTRDYQKIIDWCSSHERAIVINFASQSMVAESWKSPWDWYETNVIALSRLTSELVSRKIILDRFINFSTPEVYGSTKDWISENFNFSPNTPYAISRAAGDQHLKLLFENFKFPVIFTRAANVYGEFQPRYRLIPKTLVYGLVGKKFPLHGSGNSERSFIHVDDVSNALLKIITNGVLGATYHISTNRIEKISTILNLCADQIGIDSKDLCNLSEERIGKDFAYKLNSNYLRETLGWTDVISLEVGISRTLRWIKENLNEILSSADAYKHRI